MKLLLIFPLLLTGGSYAFFKLAGPYEFTVEGPTDCNNVGSGLLRHYFKVRKVNSTTRLLQGRAVFKIPIDEKTSYELDVAKWTSGGWGMNAYNMKGDDVCAMMYDYAIEVYEALYKKALGAPVHCPVPAGVYDMESGMELVFRNFSKFPSLPYGRYKAEMKFFTGKELLGCLELTDTIEQIAG